MPEETKPPLLDDKGSERNKLGTCAGFCECGTVPHRIGLCTGDNWQPIAATEETKPVEREAFEMWVKSLPKCVGDSGSCDGSLVGLEHEPHCPMYGKQFATGEDAFIAGWDAALERAAPDWFHYADKVAQKIGWPFTKLDELSEILRDEYRALKGRE